MSGMTQGEKKDKKPSKNTNKKLILLTTDNPLNKAYLLCMTFIKYTIVTLFCQVTIYYKIYKIFY